MKITLLGLLVVLGASLLVLYIVVVNQDKNPNHGPALGPPRFPDDSNSPQGFA